MTFGNKGGFAVLSLSSKRKKKPEPEPVADDWEAAEEEEEEKEGKAQAGSSGVVSEDDGGPSRPRSRGLPEAEATPASAGDETPLSTKAGELVGSWADIDE
jgi:transcriptional repressor NF-X1